jgi:hypothetical protein
VRGGDFDPFGDPFSNDPFFSGGGMGFGSGFGRMRSMMDDMMEQHQQHFQHLESDAAYGERSMLTDGAGGSSANVVAKRDGYTKTVSTRPGRGGNGGDRGPVVSRSSSSSMVCVNGKRRTIKETTLRYADGSSETVREEMK